MYARNLAKALVLVILFITSSSVHAQVRINEFSLEPQRVELVNMGDSNISLDGWILDDNGGSSAQSMLNGIIHAGHCMVFEDNFYLNKGSDDEVRLFAAPQGTASAQLMDNYAYKKADIDLTKSFARVPHGTGAFAAKIPSSFGFINDDSTTSCFFNEPTITPTTVPTTVPSILTPTITQTLSITPSPTAVATPTPPVSYPPILLSEIMADPGTSASEWVELYNPTTTIQTLTNWYIDDIANGGSTPKAFSLTLEPQGYGVITLSTSMFNNTGDTVRLLNPTKNEADSMEYSGSVQGISWSIQGPTSAEWCETDPTQGTAFTSCKEEAPTPMPHTNTVASKASAKPKLNKAPTPTKTPTAKKTTAKATSRSSTKAPTPAVLYLNMSRKVRDQGIVLGTATSYQAPPAQLPPTAPLPPAILAGTVGSIVIKRVRNK